MASTSSNSLWWSKWSTKQYIFAALLVTLVALVIVSAISISLAPAHMSFSISNATTSLIPVEGHPNLRNGFYNLTLVAINTSRRMWVHYSSLSTRIWYSSTAYILAEDVNTTTALPRWQRPRNSTAVAIYADYGQYDETGKPVPGTTMTDKQLDAEKATVNCRVVVETTVRFKFGLLPTRPYTVRVTCRNVSFTTGGRTNGPVWCN